jgi:hypothetical protein
MIHIERSKYYPELLSTFRQKFEGKSYRYPLGYKVLEIREVVRAYGHNKGYLPTELALAWIEKDGDVIKEWILPDKEYEINE